MLVGSFLPFYEMDLAPTESEGGFEEFGAALFGFFIETSWSAWSDAWSIFPLLTLCVVLSILVGLVAGLRRFTAVRTPVFGNFSGVRGHTARRLRGSVAAPGATVRLRMARRTSRGRSWVSPSGSWGRRS